MATRFSNRPTRSVHNDSGSARGDGIGEWWAAITVVALTSVAVVALSGSVHSASVESPTVDRIPRVLESLEPAERQLDEVDSAFAALCREPVLLALELEPDCETGVISLPDDLFDGFGSAQLSPVAKEDLAAAMRTYLSRLRQLPALWDSLEAIEIRGHTDPRAVRQPYWTNMVGSQQRALGVLLFLIGPNGLSNSDQDDLRRLAIVSGASFSRPPEDCPDESRECYPEWRRVEIRPVLSEALRRGDWSRTLQQVRDVASAPPSGGAAAE